ncbi:MAG: hypothetical protein Greene041619_673 [Candidatus Peregrinibacteria bacterium Greene0416_19]|nr:MAG: hypothetical protein Greene041619_673 [Candidatus Peregrinibacteria bacterium Greene0416_19]
MNLMPASASTHIPPRTLMAFERRFRDEDDCREYLEELRWPDGFRCSCGSDRAWRTARWLWKCAACGSATSVTSGTVFHGSRLSLMTWFRAIWSMTGSRTGASALELQHSLELGSYRTAWTMLHVIRRMMQQRRRPLLGRIDVGIRCFCGGGWQCAPGSNQSSVIIAVEENDAGVGRIRMRVLVARTPTELRAFLEDVVAIGSSVHPDDAEARRLLDASGYKQPPARPSTRAGSRIQLTAGLVKRWLIGTHQGRVDHAYLQEYLDEFSFRFNRRNVPHSGTLFSHVLTIAVTTPDKA